MKQRFWLLFLTTFLIIVGCRKEDASLRKSNPSEKQFQSENEGFVENDMVLYWNEKIATVLGAPMNQPTRSRFFAIMHIALHDALNSIKPKYKTYALVNHREKKASPDAAVASAGYWVIKGLNRQGSFPIDDWYAESLATVPDGSEKELGISLGKTAAEAIIADRATDGFSQVVFASVNPANGTTPGVYRQTNMINMRFIPTWGTLLRPFVVSSNSAFRPPGPHDLSSTGYTTDYNEVKQKGGRVGSTRTAAEQTIAQFWADNKPSLIWNNFTRSAISQKKLDAWKTARLFAVLYTAMADGINTAMESKYHFYRWRPETAIREGANDGNDQTEGDADWAPGVMEAPNPTNPMAQLVSPPVPEYPSSFAMFGGVTEKILKWFLNTDQVSVSLTSSAMPGTVLHYNSITQAALDNTLGKIYAGWYFRKAAVDGHQMGKDIAAYVSMNHFGETGE